MMTISVIIGSTRQGRFSEKPAQWILQELRKREAIEARLLDLRDFPMPFFDQPMPPAMPGRPPYEHEVVKKWTAQIAASDGFVFVTPEYNYGPSAVLKNAIDVASRPYGKSAWSGKPGAVISVSPGAIGGFGANHALRQSLVFLDVPAMPQPEAYIGKAATLFDDNGALVDTPTREFMQKFLQAFAQWIERNAPRS